MAFSVYYTGLTHSCNPFVCLQQKEDCGNFWSCERGDEGV